MVKPTHTCHQLSLQRCRQYIAHIHALIYMEGPGRGKACAVHDNIHSLLSLLDQELQENQKRLTTDEPVAAPPRRRNTQGNVYHFRPSPETTAHTHS